MAGFNAGCDPTLVEPGNEPLVDRDRALDKPAQAWWNALVSPDFLLDLVFCLLLMCVPFALTPHQRPTPVQTLQLPAATPEFVLPIVFDSPFSGDTVPTFALRLIAGGVPVLTALGLSVVSPLKGSVKAWCHSYLYTMAFQVLLVNAAKFYCGYWRPYFLVECGFDISFGACTADKYDRAFRSFPSGHSATSMASMFHTSLRLLGASRVGSAPYRIRLGARASVDVSGVLTCACLLPTVLACWIAASRVHDNAHHPADVVAGALIGGSSALLFYLRYFHAPFGPEADRPRQVV